MPKTRHAYCGTCGKLILAGDVVIFHSAPTKFRSAYYRCRECPAEGARIVPAA